MSSNAGWGLEFDEPIKTGKRKLITLRDAGEYIAALPARMQKMPRWEAAAQALMLVAETGQRDP